MKTVRYFLLALSAMLMLWTPQGYAEDIDLYTGNPTAGEVPNVLFVLDNASSFNASVTGGCKYSAAVESLTAAQQIPSLNGKAFGIVQCAIYNVIHNLALDSINIGFMAFNGNITRFDAQPCNTNGNLGGCLLRKLTKLNSTNRPQILSWIRSWENGFNMSGGSISTGAVMQEAWAYYSGNIGISGFPYSGVKPAAGCQKNYVIYVGNAFTNSTTPADNGGANVDTRLTAAGGDANAITLASGQYGIRNSTDTGFVFRCTTNNAAESNSNTTYTMGVNDHSKTSGLYADEWTRFMAGTDIFNGSTDPTGKQNIGTYTIGMLAPGCRIEYPALLTSMAKEGGGKYYAVANDQDLSRDLEKALSEIQSVNSVFASASLPVSVNAQGTFLNQVFLGMFRPDASASPRWVGNLKQYQFALLGTPPKLVLADKTGAGALAATSTGTGFLSATAVSFWTESSDFFKNMAGSPARISDSPDGELVDRGGAAQQLRLENLTRNFLASEGTASNPRRLYTYCPDGGAVMNCTTDSAKDLKSNLFAVSNTNIPSNVFGSTSPRNIESLGRIGTTATVKAIGHGFSPGDVVKIENASPLDPYSGDKTIVSVTTDTFTFNVADNPPTPAAGTFVAKIYDATGELTIKSIVRTTTPTGDQTVMVTTNSGHSYSPGSKVIISGGSAADGSELYAAATVATTPASDSFTYSIPIFPVSPGLSPTNVYSASLVPDYVNMTITSITYISGSGPNSIYEATTVLAHKLHVGQTISISAIVTGVIASGGSANKWGLFNGTAFTVDTAPTVANKFRLKVAGGPSNWTGTEAKLNQSTTAQTIVASNISRSGSGTLSPVSSIATATVASLPPKWFGHDPLDLTYRPKVNIQRPTGPGTNEGAYIYPNALNSTALTVTCLQTDCTSFTYPVVVTPPPVATPSVGMKVSLDGVPAPIALLTRDVNGIVEATLVGVTSPFSPINNKITVTRSVSDSIENAYTGAPITITCKNAACTIFSYGPIVQTPAILATALPNTMMTVTKGNAGPNRDDLIRWVRGHDNFGGEKGPLGGVTVRPSVHGDVLHSRPTIINYGDARGTVAFYGANDGVFRAVNAKQTLSNGSIPAGGELWGLVLPEHYVDLDRLRTQVPALKLPSVIIQGATPKDYFVDGPTGAFQKLCSATSCTSKGYAEGTIGEAYLYLTMRRGGRFLYALDVTEPNSPKIKWRKSSNELGKELGYTWSRPRVTVVKGYPKPVLVFGAGYDQAEDSEPPNLSEMGRGIFVLDADTGALIWSATNGDGATAGCTGTATQAACIVPTMTHSIPSDVTFLDRDNDGFTDRIYVGDMGGNVWRVDLSGFDPPPSIKGNVYTPDFWRVTKLAALGCDSGACPVTAPVTTPRKFFFAPTVIRQGVTGLAESYDAVLIGSGDREHPLTSSAPGSSHLVKDRFYMIKDTTTTTLPNLTTAVTTVRTEQGGPSSPDGRLFKAFSTFNISAAGGFVGVLNADLSVTMTVTTTAVHGFSADGSVIIEGATPPTLDGQFQIDSVSSNSFTYKAPSGYALSGNSGRATASRPYVDSVASTGFYTYLATGEKVVNAPLTVSGTTFFGTNRPTPPGTNVCSNLGEARGYALNPFTALATSTEYAGGGLPPSPVAGLVKLTDDPSKNDFLRFCMGCGGSPTTGTKTADEASSIGNVNPYKSVRKKPSRPYWYRK